MKIISSIYVKIASWILIVSFFTVYVFKDYAYASLYLESQYSDTFRAFADMPVEYGNIIEKYTASDKTGQVVLIQDLHANYEVQKNIKRILDFVKENYDFNEIGVEGNCADVDVSILSTIPEKDIKAETVDYFMKKGYVTGAEDFAVANVSLKLKGIEDVKLYEKGSELLISSLNKRDEFVEKIEKIKYLLRNVEGRLCSSDLKKFRNQYILYRQNSLSSVVFQKYIQEWARKAGYSLNNISPEYAKFITLNQKYDSLDFNETEKEYKKLAEVISKQRGSSILENFKNFFKNPKNLREEMSELIFSDSSYSNLRKYIECVQLSKEINTYDIAREEDRVVKTISYALAETEEEKAYLFVSDYTQLMVKFLLNQITPYDFILRPESLKQNLICFRKNTQGIFRLWILCLGFLNLIFRKWGNFTV